MFLLNLSLAYKRKHDLFSSQVCLFHVTWTFPVLSTLMEMTEFCEQNLNFKDYGVCIFWLAPSWYQGLPKCWTPCPYLLSFLRSWQWQINSPQTIGPVPHPHSTDSRCSNLSAKTETTEIKTTCLLPQYQSHNNEPQWDWPQRNLRQEFKRCCSNNSKKIKTKRWMK